MTFQRVKPAGFAVNEKLTSAQLNALDIDHANAIDGAAGGTYAPSTAIVIGGVGLNPTLKAATWPNFAADGTRTFTRTFPVAATRAFLGNGSTIAPGYLTGQAAGFVANCMLTLPDSATLTSVVLRFAMATHVSLPTLGVGFAVTRVTPSTNAWATLNSGDPALPAFGGTPSAAVRSPTSTLVAYNAANALTYTPNQNNVVDRTQYVYLLWIIDETGGGAIAGNVFQSIDATYTLADLRVA